MDLVVFAETCIKENDTVQIAWNSLVDDKYNFNSAPQLCGNGKIGLLYDKNLQIMQLGKGIKSTFQFAIWNEVVTTMELSFVAIYHGSQKKGTHV